MNPTSLLTYQPLPITFSLKKEKRLSLLESERTLNAFDRRAAVQEVNRAINRWYYQR